MEPLPYPEKAETARRMREEFDAAFASAARENDPDSEDLLAIRLGGDGYALRIREMAGIAAGRKILPLPGAPAGLLGLSGVRGTLFPVWDLASLLGYPASPREPRWLALGPGDSPWALAFEELDGYLRVTPSEVTRAAERAETPGAGFADEACSAGGTVRRIVSLRRVLETVKGFSQASRTRKDR